MDFAKFQNLVEKRTGFRTMDDAMASGEYFSDSCGDMYTYYLKIGPGERIEDISYFTTGCGFGTATCSLLVELARGKTIDQALAISDEDIMSALGGYPEKKKRLSGAFAHRFTYGDRRLPDENARPVKSPMRCSRKHAWSRRPSRSPICREPAGHRKMKPRMPRPKSSAAPGW